jgi:hypothetical protein
MSGIVCIIRYECLRNILTTEFLMVLLLVYRQNLGIDELYLKKTKTLTLKLPLLR